MAKVPKMKAGEDSEVSSALKPSPLPNFRRFSRADASDTLKEDRVIKRFFVILLNDFKKEVKLPLQFCRELGKIIPRDAVLISYQGMWTIDFGRCNCHKELVLSGDGWNSFIHHHGLKTGDFIWFEQTDTMVFRIHIFDLSADGEKFLPGDWLAKRPPHSIVDHVFSGCNFGSLHQHGFTVNIEAFHLKKSYLSVPADFVRRNVDLKQKKRVIMVNSGGHAWEVELRNLYDSRASEEAQVFLKLRRGWPAFFKANNLQMKDFVVFVVDKYSKLSGPDNMVMHVRIRRTL